MTAFFNGQQVKPLFFKWNSREYTVTKINMVHSTREGRDKIYYFSVIDNANYFKLKYNSSTLQWSLEETYPNF